MLTYKKTEIRHVLNQPFFSVVASFSFNLNPNIGDFQLAFQIFKVVISEIKFNAKYPNILSFRRGYFL